MSATKSENREFVLPFQPSDIYKVSKWLGVFHPDIWVGDYELDDDTMLVVGMTTYYDDDVEGIEGRDSALLNQWTAMRSGQCEICQSFPAKHHLHNVGDFVFAGVCDACVNGEDDDEL